MGAGQSTLSPFNHRNSSSTYRGADAARSPWTLAIDEIPVVLYETNVHNPGPSAVISALFADPGRDRPHGITRESLVVGPRVCGHRCGFRMPDLAVRPLVWCSGPAHRGDRRDPGGAVHRLFRDDCRAHRRACFSDIPWLREDLFAEAGVIPSLVAVAPLVGASRAIRLVNTLDHESASRNESRELAA